MESEGVRGGSHGSHMYKNHPNPTHVNRDAPLPSPTSKPKAAHAHRRFRQIRYEVNLLDYQTSRATISPSPSPFPILATPIIMLAAASSFSTTWLRGHRIRYLFLLLFSPILIPFLCAIFPLLCAAELCLRLCRRRMKTSRDEAGEEEERMRRCEEGRDSGSAAAAAAGKEDGKEEMGLLQRYLEDQLLLVGSVYDCADDDSDDLYHEIHNYDNDSNTTPLLA